ncbi:MAG: hypothetical protein K940chlam8_01047, partial [Chlamydiae bacterium]|nr:hypothetical protein [Chlamydiota bacterium]
DYIIQDNKIVIIDEHTGRAQPGRRFSDGLHQSIEAKEGVKIQEETQTYATITLQNYFRLYDKLAGMSGTAMTEARELDDIYKLYVVVVPTYKPSQRTDYNDEIYMTEREKYHAILKAIKELHAQGRPILIGTESVEISEKLSRIFKTNNLPHTILNARHHEKEAEVIAQAGQKGAITISTNMAGRGTDIKLGEGVAKLGGLHVLGTTRHHSRRIDRQLRGRSARLGDPGSTKFYASFEDSLIRMFASPKMTQLIQRFRPPEGEAITSPILTRSIETAQKRIEQRNFTIRKHTLEYDDVMNTQRKEVYHYRLELLKASNLMPYAEEIIIHVIEHITSELNPFDSKLFAECLMEQFPLTFETQDFSNTKQEAEKQAIEKLHQAFLTKITHQKTKLKEHHELIENLSNAGLITAQIDDVNVDDMLYQILRTLFVSSIDKQWQEHLLHIDHLRTEVGMRAIGQKDPLMEFKHESFTLFDRFINTLRQIIAKSLFKFEINVPDTQAIEQRLAQLQMTKERSFMDAPTPQAEKTIEIEPVQETKKPNRNDPCPCGSGKKYKKCCGFAASISS